MQLRGSHLSKREVQSVKLCSFVELIPVKVLALIGGQVVRGAQLAKVSVGAGNVESVKTEHDFSIRKPHRCHRWGMNIRDTVGLG